MKIKILVVDDSAVMRKMVMQTVYKGKIFTKDNTEFSQAADGLKGLEAFKKEKPHVVLSDWNMPNMDGLTMISKIRELDQNVSIVMITTEGTEDKVNKAMEAGATGYIVKPLKTGAVEEKLLEMIKKLKESMARSQSAPPAEVPKEAPTEEPAKEAPPATDTAAPAAQEASSAEAVPAQEAPDAPDQAQLDAAKLQAEKEAAEAAAKAAADEAAKAAALEAEKQKQAQDEAARLAAAERASQEEAARQEAQQKAEEAAQAAAAAAQQTPPATPTPEAPMAEESAPTPEAPPTLSQAPAEPVGGSFIKFNIGGEAPAAAAPTPAEPVAPQAEPAQTPPPAASEPATPAQETPPPAPPVQEAPAAATPPANEDSVHMTKVEGRAKTVIPSVFSEILELAVLPVETAPNLEEDSIVSNITVVGGNFAGFMSLVLPQQSALKIASAMMGMEITAMCDDVSDAVGEMINLISGGIKTALAADSITFEISVPTIVTGKTVELRTRKAAAKKQLNYQFSDGLMFAFKFSFYELENN